MQNKDPNHEIHKAAGFWDGFNAKADQIQITPLFVLCFFIILMFITAALWFIPAGTRRLFILIEFFMMFYFISKVSR